MIVGEVQALNVIAVEGIERGDLEEAARILSEAISKLAWCSLQPTPLADDENDLGDSSCSSYASDEESSSVIVYCSSDDVDDVDDEEEEDEEMPPRASFLPKPVRKRSAKILDEETAFFDKPFLFECNTSMMQDETDGLTTQEYTCSAMTCLFNLGLCFHSQWQRQAPHPAHLIQHALHYYEQALSLLTPAMVQYPHAVAPSNVDNNRHVKLLKTILQLLMALCTNALHCQAELVNYPQVHLWTSRLQHCLKLHHHYCRVSSLSSSSSSRSKTTPRANSNNSSNVVDDDNAAHPLLTVSTSKVRFFSRKAFFNDFIRVAAHAA